MSGKRITPEEVVAAYRSTGLSPNHELFVDESEACALGAIFRSRNPTAGALGVCQFVAAEYGWSYAYPFSEGFGPPVEEEPEALANSEAYADGRACWEAVSKEFNLQGGNP